MQSKIVNVKVNGTMTRDFLKNVKSYSLCSKCRNVSNCEMRMDLVKKPIQDYDYIKSGYEERANNNFVVTKCRKYIRSK